VGGPREEIVSVASVSALGKVYSPGAPWMQEIKGEAGMGKGLTFVIILVCWLPEYVLVQPEMERWRFPLASISALQAGIFKASIRLPGYPSAWLRPRSGVPDRGSGQSGKELRSVYANTVLSVGS